MSKNGAKRVRCRLAPSPTGFLHIGNIRTALFCYLYAKKHGGDFIVRIEDTDTKRTVDGAVDFIYKSLDWLGLTPDASTRNPDSYGPYNQLSRDYSNHIKYLLDNDLVYYAFDTADDLDKARADAKAMNSTFMYNHVTRGSMKNSISLSKDTVDKLIADGTPYVIRFKTPRNVDVVYTDKVYGTIKVNSDTLDDKVLVKSNGIPTYHLANVCDDHDMAITHVIRGNDWLPSTPLHCLLYDAFGWDRPVFAHLPLIVGNDNKPISKRSAKKHGYSVFMHKCTTIDSDGSKFTLDGYSDMGYDPRAIINYLALLGWSPKDDTDIMSIDDLIDKFDLNGLNKSNARWDFDKLKWLNSHYVSTLPSSVILDYVDDTDYAKSKLDYYNSFNDKIDAIFDVSKVRAVIKDDLKPFVDIFFKLPIVDLSDSNLSDDYKKVMSTFVDIVRDSDFDDIDNVKNIIYDTSNTLGVKFGVVMKGLRVALTGGISGPDLMSTMDILGYNDSINRIKATL